MLYFILLLATAGVRLSLNGTCIANYGFVDVDDIGEGDNALFCHTDKDDCCSLQPNRAGEWYYPNGNKVKIMGGSGNAEFYRDRGTQIVRLHHREGTITGRGLFRCEIPDADNKMQSAYAYIGMPILC